MSGRSAVRSSSAARATAANPLAREADVVIGIGTRWSDFTTASRTAFAHPGVRFVNVNIAAFDAAKHSGLSIVADARSALEALTEALSGYDTGAAYREKARNLADIWDQTVERAYRLGNAPLPSQPEVIGAVNEVSEPRDVVVLSLIHI